MDFDRKVGLCGRVVRLIAGHQGYGFISTRIGIRHILGNFQIIRARLNIPGNNRLVP